LIKNILIQFAKGVVRKTNKISWHNLRSIQPVSTDFGFTRGIPVDRYYIEKFLEENKSYIQGRVLEVADSTYSKKFNSGVEKFEIFSTGGENVKATVTGDLTNPSSLPENMIDCFICTQTFNFIYDVKKAIEGSFKLLKPGGVILCTVAGLCQVSRYDMDRWGDYWRFTDLSIRKMFSEVFGEQNVELSIFGNVLSATALLQGISSEELKTEELNFNDRNYQVVISVVAKK